MATKRHEHCSFPHQPKQWLKGNLIGSGSFGSVHLAIDSATKALFVAKYARSKAGISSLENEADILENLDSPHIIKCIGKDLSSSSSSSATLFFEYMAGGSLFDVVQKFGGGLDEKSVRVYTRGILQGLKYLHKNNIVHCDVKCKNILVDASGAIKLADFGCSRRLISNQESKTSSKFCNGNGGTPLWMAPEVLRNEPLDFAADIWSLGCAIIEMATGRPPWGNEAAKNPMAAILRIAKGDDIPQLPQHFSSEGLDFLSKCLERDPRKRWTSRELLRHPFVAEKCTYATAASSPTSVLDAPIYDSDKEENGSKCNIDQEGFRGVEWLLERKFPEDCVAKNGFEEMLEKDEDDDEEEWITVRE